VLTQREFLKKLVGSAAGVAGLAAVGGLLTPTPAEAAYSPGGAAPGTPAGFGGFPAPATTGDYVNTNLLVEGHLEVKGYRPWIDVTAHGAVGDWSQWADTAVANAIAALPITGGVIYFPPGIYAFQQPINININKHLTIMGAGRAVTMLYWSPNATTGGLHIQVGDPGYKVTVHDLLLYTDAVSSTPALSFNPSYWSGGPTATPHIHDIWITHGGAPGARWAKGIEMTHGSGAKIERFEIVCGPGATHGMHFHTGSTIINICAGVLMMPTGATGIEVDGNISEGIYIRGVEVVGGAIGYKFVSPSPGTAISDSHASTTDFRHLHRGPRRNGHHRQPLLWRHRGPLHRHLLRRNGAVGRQPERAPYAHHRQRLLRRGWNHQIRHVHERNVLRQHHRGQCPDRHELGHRVRCGSDEWDELQRHPRQPDSGQPGTALHDGSGSR
jgi:hypothetical protein